MTTKPLSTTVVETSSNSPIVLSLASKILIDRFFEHKKNHQLMMIVFFGLGMAMMFKLTHGLI